MSEFMSKCNVYLLGLVIVFSKVLSGVNGNLESVFVFVGPSDLERKSTYN